MPGNYGPFFDPFHGNGHLLRLYPDKAVWYTEMDGEVITCTQTLATPILEDAARDRANSAGKRWGDGQRVMSIPLPLYFQKILPARQNDDLKYIKRFINDIDNRNLRTFGGDV